MTTNTDIKSISYTCKINEGGGECLNTQRVAHRNTHTEHSAAHRILQAGSQQYFPFYQAKSLSYHQEVLVPTEDLTPPASLYMNNKYLPDNKLCIAHG